MDYRQFKNLLMRQIHEAGSQTAFAKTHGVSIGYIGHIVHGRKEPSRKLVQSMGYDIKTTFVKREYFMNSDAQNWSTEYREKRYEWHKVKDNLCPDCGADLDTGWECNGCGKDWRDVGLAAEPKPEDYPQQTIPDEAIAP